MAGVCEPWSNGSDTLGAIEPRVGAISMSTSASSSRNAPWTSDRTRMARRYSVAGISSAAFNPAICFWSARSFTLPLVINGSNIDAASALMMVPTSVAVRELGHLHFAHLHAERLDILERLLEHGAGGRFGRLVEVGRGISDHDLLQAARELRREVKAFSSRAGVVGITARDCGEHESASSAERHIGPILSSVHDSGIAPWRLTRP